jgi:hypothetical protein
MRLRLRKGRTGFEGASAPEENGRLGRSYGFGKVAPARKGLRPPKRTDGSEGVRVSEGANGGARVDGASVPVRRAPAGAPKEPSGLPRRVSWVPTRRGFRTSAGKDTLSAFADVFGCPRSPKRSSDLGGTRRGFRTSEGKPDAVFGAQRDGQPDRNRRGLRIARAPSGSSRTIAVSVVGGARWGARWKRRGLRVTARKAGRTEPIGPSGPGGADRSSGANGASASRALGCGLRISGAASAAPGSERDRSNRSGLSGLGQASERFGRSEPSGSWRAGRCPSHVDLRTHAARAGRLIRRSFGSGGSSGRSVRTGVAFGLRYGRIRTGVRHEGASVPEGRTAERPERTFGKSRAGAARQEGASAPEGRATVRLEGTSVPESGATVRLEGASALEGRATGRLGGASAPAGWTAAVSARQGFGSGGTTAAVRARGDLGLRGCERERDVEMVTSGDQRQEGIGAGDGVRPRNGRKALKGATP